jgi:osmoprotectant transport system ATP-binding protein
MVNTLEKAFAAMAEVEILKVVDEDKSTVNWVDRASLFRYLSETKH